MKRLGSPLLKSDNRSDVRLPSETSAPSRTRRAIYHLMVPAALALLSPFAGVFYPISTLPGWMRFISRLLPASYVFEGMRAVIAGRGVPTTIFLRGAVLAVIYLLLAGWVFGHVFRLAVRTGLIARYSAETTS